LAVLSFRWKRFRGGSPGFRPLRPGRGGFARFVVSIAETVSWGRSRPETAPGPMAPAPAGPSGGHNPARFRFAGSGFWAMTPAIARLGRAEPRSGAAA